MGLTHVPLYSNISRYWLLDILQRCKYGKLPHQLPGCLAVLHIHSLRNLYLNMLSPPFAVLVPQAACNTTLLSWQHSHLRGRTSRSAGNRM